MKIPRYWTYSSKYCLIVPLVPYIIFSWRRLSGVDPWSQGQKIFLDKWVRKSAMRFLENSFSVLENFFLHQIPPQEGGFLLILPRRQEFWTKCPSENGMLLSNLGKLTYSGYQLHSYARFFISKICLIIDISLSPLPALLSWTFWGSWVPSWKRHSRILFQLGEHDDLCFLLSS